MVNPQAVRDRSERSARNSHTTPLPAGLEGIEEPSEGSDTSSTIRQGITSATGRNNYNIRSSENPSNRRVIHLPASRGTQWVLNSGTNSDRTNSMSEVSRNPSGRSQYSTRRGPSTYRDRRPSQPTTRRVGSNTTMRRPRSLSENEDQRVARPHVYQVPNMVSDILSPRSLRNRVETGDLRTEDAVLLRLGSSVNERRLFNHELVDFEDDSDYYGTSSSSGSNDTEDNSSNDNSSDDESPLDVESGGEFVVDSRETSEQPISTRDGSIDNNVESDSDVEEISSRSFKRRRGNNSVPVTIIDSDEDQDKDDVDVVSVVDMLKEPPPSDLKAKKGLSSFKCPVCYDEPQNAVVVTCGHMYCSDCVTKALSVGSRATRSKGICCVCRKPVKFSSIVALEIRQGKPTNKTSDKPSTEEKN